MNAFARLCEQARARPIAGGDAPLRELESGAWPQPRAERWRYAKLRSLDAISQFAPPATLAALPSGAVPAALPGFKRLTLRGGLLLPEHCDGSLHTRVRPVEASPGVSAFALISRLFNAKEMVLGLNDGDQVEILHVAGGASEYPRLCIEVAAGAQVGLVERHLPGATISPPGHDGAAPAFLQAPVLTLKLAERASLAHYRLQQTSTVSRWYDTLHAELEADSRWNLRQISLGAEVARSTLSASLAGARAELVVHALAVGAEQQTHDTLIDIVHSAPLCRSQLIFRGIAAGHAHVAVGAEARVEATAAGADVTQSLKGLAENPGAEIDLRPRLTILTDDVKARHGASTGQLDEQLLFYLLSRGLERDAARSLLKWAFLGDVLGAVDLPALRSATAHAVAGRLGAAWLAEAAQ